MAKVMKVKDFVAKAKDIANNYKTLYVLGCFGAPLKPQYKDRYINKNSYNKGRASMIKNASSDTFGFDCVCLIKAILWGWSGNKNHVYGGATYKANGVPDIGADTIIGSSYCTNISTNFNKIDVGEIVWLSGHVGIYIGNGKVVECSPAFKNKVQITKLSQRKWVKHGKLKYIDYSSTTSTTTTTNKTPAKTTTTQKFKIGDNVIISGNLYKNSNANTPSGTIKNKITKITRYSKGTKHPYNTTGDIGWIDESSIKLVTTNTTSTSKKYHTVKKGETLWTLAIKYYGKGSKYTEIKKLNGLKSDIISIGQKLRVK